MSASKVLSLMLKLSVEGSGEVSKLESQLKSIATLGRGAGSNVSFINEAALANAGKSVKTLDDLLKKTEADAAKLAETNKKVADAAFSKLVAEAEKLNKAFDAAAKSAVVVEERARKAAAVAFSKVVGEANKLNKEFDAAASKATLLADKAKKAAEVSFAKVVSEAESINKAFDKDIVAFNKFVLVAAQTADKSTASFQKLVDKIDGLRNKLVGLGTGKIVPDIDTLKLAAADAQAKKLASSLYNVGQGANAAGSGIKGIGGGGGGSGGGSGLGGLGDEAERSNTSLRRLASTALLVRSALFAIGAVGVAREILQTAIAFDTLNAKFNVVFGKAQAGDQFLFIKKEADRLGLSIIDLANSYANLVQATKTTTISQEAVKRVFLDIAQAGAQLSLSQDDIAGSLKAVEQIASKGTVQLEELRGQLGDRLPGAISVFATGLGVTEQKLNTLLAAGISSKVFFESFGKGLELAFGLDNTVRIDTLASAIQRFKNQIQILFDTSTKGTGNEQLIAGFNKLSTVISSPEFQKGFKDIVAFLLQVGVAITENIGVISKLVLAFASLSAISFVGDKLLGVAKGFAIASENAKLASTAVTAAGGAAGTSSGLFTLLSKSIALASAAGVALVAGGAAINIFFDNLNDKVAKAAAALNTLQDLAVKGVQLNFAAKGLSEQIAQLQKYKDVTLLSREQVRLLGEDQIFTYEEGVRGAAKLAKAQEDFTANRLQAIKAEITANKELLAQVGEQSLFNSPAENAAILESQTKLTEKIRELTGVYDGLATKQQQQIGKTLETTKAADDAAAAFAKYDFNINAITTTGLTNAQKLITDAFDTNIKKGEEVSAVLEKIIPKDFGTGGAATIRDLIPALTALKNEGKISGDQLNESLLKPLEKLSNTGLGKFEENVRAGFKAGEFGANSFATTLNTAVKASLNNLGVDAKSASENVSTGFGKNIQDLRNLEKNAVTTGATLKAAFEKVLTTAKTREELLLLQKELNNVTGTETRKAIEALQGDLNKLSTEEGRTELRNLQLELENTKKFAAQFGNALADTEVRVQDSLRLIAGALDSSLGDSFNRLGVKTKEALQGVADQAGIDFARLSASGLASASSVREAFLKAADDITKANNGIPPITLLVEARNLDAFQVIADIGKKAADKIKADFESALSSVTTSPQLELLKSALEGTFAAGRISAQTFGIELLAIRTKFLDIRDAALSAFTGVFNVAVREATTASDQIKSAFEGALGGAGTRAQLESLRSGLADAFSAGNLSARDLAITVDELNAKLTLLSDTVDGNVIGAFTRLGVQTRDQLSKIAAQAESDFNTIDSSGQATAKGLEDAFLRYAESTIAANDGIASSFLALKADSLGLSDQLDAIIAKTQKAVNAIKTITLPANKELTDADLQRKLVSLVQEVNSGRGFVDEAVIKAVIEEIRARGLDPARNFNFRDPSNDPNLKKTARNDAGGGNINNTFNINSQVTAEQISSIIIPGIARQTQRTGG